MSCSIYFYFQDEDEDLQSTITAYKEGILDTTSSHNVATKIEEGMNMWRQGLKLQQKGLKILQEVSELYGADLFVKGMQNEISSASVFSTSDRAVTRPTQDGSIAYAPVPFLDETGKRQQKCLFCDFHMSSYGGTMTHMATEHVKQMFACQYCGVQTTWSYEKLITHERMCSENSAQGQSRRGKKRKAPQFPPNFTMPKKVKTQTATATVSKAPDSNDN